MKIEIAYLEDKVYEIVCIFEKDSEAIDKFDKAFANIYEQNKCTMVNDEKRYTKDLESNIQLIISKKNNEQRRLIFQDTYCAIGVDYLDDIHDYLSEHQLIDENDFSDLETVVKFVTNYTDQIKEQVVKIKGYQNLLDNRTNALFNDNNLSKVQAELAVMNSLLQRFKLENKDNLRLLKQRCEALPSIINKDGVCVGLSEKFQIHSKLLAKFSGQLQSFVAKFDTFSKPRNLFLTSQDQFSFVIDHLQPCYDAELIDRLIIDKTTPIRQLTLKQNSNLNLQGVNRIKLITENKGDDLDCANNCILEINVNKHKKFYQMDNNILSLRELINLFLDKGCTVDFSACNMKKGALGVKFFNNLSGYVPNIESDYVNIHCEISREIVSIIERSLMPPVEITFIGCGKGEEIKDVVDYLENNHIQYMIYGFDISTESIKAAKIRPEFKGKNIHFIDGDGNHFDEIIKAFRKNNTNIKPQTSITVASGFLTRLVNKDSVEAFEIFKKIAHFTDTIIISGRTHTLIKPRDAKSAGMHVTNRTFYSNDALRTLDRYDYDQHEQCHRIFANIEKQKTTEQFINLNDHARPIEVIRQLINDYQFNLNSWTISLRNAYIDIKDDNEIMTLYHLLRKYNLKLIASGTEDWFVKLQGIDNCVLQNIEIVENQFTSFNEVADEGEIALSERDKVSSKMQLRAQQAMEKIKIY